MLYIRRLTRIFRIAGLFLVLSVLLGLTLSAEGPVAPTADAPAPAGPETSHRLIVELDSPPLALYSPVAVQSQTPDGRLDVSSPAAQRYIQRLQSEQEAFISDMQVALPEATVSTYLNEYGRQEQATYQIVLNGMAVEPGETDREVARRQLEQLPGVKGVYLDHIYTSDLYTSTHLIGAPLVWDLAGGREDAGSGVKVASMDGGIHKDAPMFDGTDYSYPAGYPKGLTANTNGKIIASRVYFRSWDPPASGDENPWPGENGTPHGVHTSGIAAGDVVTGSYLGLDFPNMSGVAPKAYVMSYRVFYASVNGIGAFYTAEGLAALEDIVADGADVLNNSWGGGPGSAGGEFDPLDQALINAAEAGIFVSMSAGNAGPGSGTTDHPSDDYINVAATTTGGTLASGVLNVTAPEPVTSTLQEISFGTAEFGAPLPIGTTISHTFATAAAVDPDNVTGCDPFPDDAFDGQAAVISRGDCNFSDKVRHAQQAGATFAVIYNNVGDDILNMACGDDCSDITIASVFIGQTYGEGMVDWYAEHGEDSVLEIDTTAFQSENEPDHLASFSSRGPGVGHVLKPDIAAPGVNILSQGYTPGATGEARHLGYGQASGTSMAAPHVAGAAALIRQLYPEWSNAYIKSAMMSTSKYLEVYNHDGSPAQPLDMGAGRLDVGAAADPGVIFDPPSLSFGAIPTGTTKSIVVEITNVTTATETYDLSTLYTGDGFTPTQTTELPGFTVDPISLTLDAETSTDFTVTFDASAGQGLGDNQGYVILEGDNGHEAHLPAWGRVMPEPAAADVLIIGSDFSYLLGYPNYLSYYTEALDELGLSYEFWNADWYFNNPVTVPDSTTLSKYDVILIYTGDHWEPDGSFTVSTPFTSLDMDRLTEYLNGGGTILAMGQDLSSVLASDETDGGSFFYQAGLGGNFLQDSVSGYALPSAPVVPLAEAPPAFDGIALDLSGPESYTGMTDLLAGQVVIHRLYLPLIVKGGATTPQVSAASTAQTSGDAVFAFDSPTGRLDYVITIEDIAYPTELSVTINRGAPGTNGPAAYTLLSETTVQTDTLVLDSAILLTAADNDNLLSGELYVAVQTTESKPFDALRGQITVTAIKDGAANQYYVDELAHRPSLQEADPDALEHGYVPLLKYPGDDWLMRDGIVAMSHRDQPTLERPGIAYFGRSIYTSFGLEGVNDETARADLLQVFLDWAKDEPTVTINDTTSPNASGLTTFQADLDSNVPGTTGHHYRWDFGDGTEVAGPFGYSQAGHVYDEPGVYTVTVEVTDSWGNTVVGSEQIAVPNVTILHTNDFHGRLETDYRGRGGSAYMASVIGDIRNQVGEENVLLMDAGDAYLAAPPISQLVLGESVIDVYNLLDYDVAAFGNHSFDKGQDVVQERVEQSEFPWLGANIVTEGTNWEHPDWIEPYVILEAGSVDIGVIGLDTDETPEVTLKGVTDGLEFKDLTDSVLHYYDEVMAQCDALIVLAHMGTEDSGPYKGLETVAQELIDAGKPVDLMIGGHQHQPLSDPLMVGDTAIIQAGYYGRWLGRADITVDPQTKKLILANYELITINDSLPADPEVEARVAEWAEDVEPIIKQVVGYTNVSLVRDYNDESNMGDLVTDGMLWKADEYDDGEINGSVDIAFTNPGGLREDIEIPAGATVPYTVTWGDTFNVMPFGNTLFLMDLTGEQVRTLLDQSASLHKGILQTSGATWYWYNDCQCDSPTSWGTYTVTVGGETLVPTQTYRIVTNDFLAGGQDGWVTFADGTDRWNTYYDMQEGVNEYIDWYNDEVGPIDHEVEDRIVYVP